MVPCDRLGPELEDTLTPPARMNSKDMIPGALYQNVAFDGPATALGRSPDLLEQLITHCTSSGGQL
ncbi:hypothetical protein APZ00_12735 [Pannonibacter phragmitetus]|uniref:Uncharacterized protein n=1 Tax=Pannonibacter phragmitetus TaxID=121719 RepID=A0A0U3FNT2_9HYPH|nr:hypothetical protein APZ00_12735 [Pannonibacter phragmitetus]